MDEGVRSENDCVDDDDVSVGFCTLLSDDFWCDHEDFWSDRIVSDGDCGAWQKDTGENTDNTTTGPKLQR